MDTMKELCKGTVLPEMFRATQIFDDDSIPFWKIPEMVRAELKPFCSRLKPGMRIAITCGSRGISNISLIIKSIGDSLKCCGAEPFVVPSMGSHGGASSEGQREVLAAYGVTEERIGFPVVSSMETVYLGNTEEGLEVHIDKNAYEADGVIVCGRIKAHTSFRHKYESGLMKMLSVGLGKQKGAEIIHGKGLPDIPRRFEPYARHVLKKINEVFGLAIIENAYYQTYKLIGLEGRDIPEAEPHLLLEAKARSGKLYLDDIDVLIVGEMGKNYSGDGMDCNVIGRFPSPIMKSEINIQHIAVLDLSEESQGNANGIGWADVTTKKLISKLNAEATYANALTSTCLNAVRIPMIADSDKQAVQVALKTCVNIDHDNPRIVYIKNTLSLDDIYISKAMLADAHRNSNIRIYDGRNGCSIFNEQGEIET